MNYGRNLDGAVADGSTEYFAIPLDEDAEAVRADVQVTGGSLNTGSLDVDVYVWDDKGDLYEVTDADTGDFTQLGSTFSISDTDAHDMGAAFRAGDYGFAIVALTSVSDAADLEVTGDFVSDTHDSAEDSALGHATAGNITEDVYTDGTAQ